ncbi:MAG: winged helix-turn-helix domain-containing protein [Actinomycetota bacterium]
MKTEDDTTLIVGMLEVDIAAYTARFDGFELDVSSSQVELLALLIANRDRVLSREDIALGIGLRHARSVDVLLTMLRRSIGRNFVRTVRRRGWILDASALGAVTRP